MYGGLVRGSRLDRLWGLALAIGDVALVVGAVAAITTGATAAVLVLLGVLLARIAVDLTVGVAGYRRVMRRPWPRVAPAVDDDD